MVPAHCPGVDRELDIAIGDFVCGRSGLSGSARLRATGCAQVMDGVEGVGRKPRRNPLTMGQWIPVDVLESDRNRERR